MSNSAYIVGADWCGFTKKQLSAIPDDLVNTEFKYVNCAAEPENPLCEGVQGFPTMKTHDGETCHTGYTQDIDQLRKDCKTMNETAADPLLAGILAEAAPTFCSSGSGSVDNAVRVVGANWCGFTNKQLNAIKDSKYASPFEYVDCATNKESKWCDGVQGFPTFKKADNTICHVGFTDDLEAVKAKCSN